MFRLVTLAAILLLPCLASAQTLQPSISVKLQDEGADQGAVKILNCTGAGIACSRSGLTATLNVSGGGGGGSANVAEAIVDFGANGATLAKTTLTGQAWVTSSSVIICAPTLFATADRADGMEDALIEGLTVAVSARAAGAGFDVSAKPRYGKAIGKFAIHCTGA